MLYPVRIAARALQAALVALLAATFTASSAAAQHTPAALEAALSPATAAALYFAASQAAPAVAEENARAPARALSAVKDANRARARIALGSGITTGSVVGLVAFGRPHYCRYQDIHLDRTVPRVVGSVLGSVGVGLLALGIVQLARMPAEVRNRPVSAGRMVGLGATAFGTGLLSSVAVFLGALDQEAQCWSS